MKTFEELLLELFGSEDFAEGVLYWGDGAWAALTEVPSAIEQMEFAADHDLEREPEESWLYPGWYIVGHDTYGFTDGFLFPNKQDACDAFRTLQDQQYAEMYGEQEV